MARKPDKFSPQFGPEVVDGGSGVPQTGGFVGPLIERIKTFFNIGGLKPKAPGFGQAAARRQKRKGVEF